jgi:glycerol-3-phosphate acyltransferase PlsX
LLRPALVVVLPTQPRPTFLLDAGAIADPKPEMLLQFAQLGVAYAQIAHNIPDPKVGLLTIGAEPGKGNKLARRAHELLAAPPPHNAPPIRFTGNVEGTDLLTSAVDVIVTDGFTGNVALKTLEGGLKLVIGAIIEIMMSTDETRAASKVLLPALAPLADQFDADTYGGAMLLGVDGVCIISHGSSGPKAIVNALKVARDSVQGEMVAQVRAAVAAGR